MKRTTSIIVAMIMSMTFLAAPSAHAGMIVFDPTNFSENILQFLEETKQTIEQTTQTIHQYTLVVGQIQQLANEAKHLVSLAQKDPAALAANLMGIQQELQTIRNLQGNVRGMVMDYRQMQSQWDSVYKGFGDYNGMSGAQYGNQAMRVLDMTEKSIKDAMEAQGLVVGIGDDMDNLQMLVEASKDADGALAAAQAGNEIAAMQIKQLTRLQTILAQSARAQTAYMEQQVQQQAAAKANSERAFKFDDYGSTPLGSGNGQGVLAYPE